MENVDYLYHYTTVDKLELILKNKTIRLRPLNTLDDLQEEMSNDAKCIGEFIFASSWSQEKQEIIPMWYMYSNKFQGVRIRLQANPFQIYNYSPEQLGQYILNPNGLSETTAIPLSDVYNSRFLVHPYHLDEQLHEVIYTQNKDDLYPSLWKKEDKKDEKMRDICTESFNYSKFGIYKNEYWSFQKEWRYIVKIFPISFLKWLILVNDGDSMLKAMHEICDGKYKLSMDHYDLVIESEKIKDMEIVLGPKISKQSREAVHALRRRYNPSAVIKESELSGLIR